MTWAKPSSPLRLVERDPSSPHDDAALVRRFQHDPDGAYTELLARYSTMLLRMIRRFMRDVDEVMEVYTSVCEKLRANDYGALRRFRADSELPPWLSVVVANACRDRFRRHKAVSVPQSVLGRLDRLEQLVFRYYYQERFRHEDIAEVIIGKHGVECTPSDVVASIQRIDELLSVKKRWLLLAALNSNRPTLSIDEMAEDGFETMDLEDADAFEPGLPDGDALETLNSALETLAEEDRLLVLLRFEQDMTAVQIADAMRYDSHKYVYTRLRTIFNRLRRTLKAADALG